MMRGKKMLLASLAAATAMSLAACAPAQRPADENASPNAYSDTSPNGTAMRDNPFNRIGFRDGRNAYPDDGVQGITNANPNLNIGRTPNNVNNVFRDADRMAEAAASVDGVENATAVIVGGTAYIGLDLDPSVDRRRADAVETEVARRVNRVVPRYHVLVTSDADLLGQLTEIDSGLRAGQPVDRFRRQLDVIDQRISEARTHRTPLR